MTLIISNVVLTRLIFIKIYCRDEEVKENCPLTCGMCGCTNEAAFEFKANNGEERHCDWLSAPAGGNSEKRIKTYCKKKNVMRACTRTCGGCHYNNKSFEFEADNAKMRNCNWLSQHKERRKRYCSKSNIQHGCPAACFCGDDSSFEFFNDSGEIKDCEWIKDGGAKRIENYCRKASVANSCQATCGVCPEGGF